eukprot:gene2877-biopygen8097
MLYVVKQELSRYVVYITRLMLCVLLAAARLDWRLRVGLRTRQGSKHTRSERGSAVPSHASAGTHAYAGR